MAVFDVNLAILALKTTIFWPKNGCFRTRKRVIGTVHRFTSVHQFTLGSMYLSL